MLRRSSPRTRTITRCWCRDPRIRSRPLAGAVGRAGGPRRPPTTPRTTAPSRSSVPLRRRRRRASRRRSRALDPRLRAGHERDRGALQEPVRIALATQNVAALFDAYGEELRVLVQSASGRTRAARRRAGGLRSPSRITSMGASRTRPPSRSDAVRTGRREPAGSWPAWTLGPHPAPHPRAPYAFEPLTDYLSTSCRANGGGGAAHGALVHRSRSPRPDSRPSGSSPTSRGGDCGAPAVPTPGLPRGAPRRPRREPAGRRVRRGRPRRAASAPLPTGPGPVVVRRRAATGRGPRRGKRDDVALPYLPTQVPGPPDASDPGHVWWAAVRRDWLSLGASNAAVAAAIRPGPGSPGSCRVPGGTRAVVLLAAGPADPRSGSIWCWPATPSPAQPSSARRRSGSCSTGLPGR